MKKEIISTKNAPLAIGTYSQAVKTGNLLFVSGQIPLHPESMDLVSDDFKAQAEQVFRNLSAICEAADSSLQDIVKLNVYLTDLGQFALFNEVMAEFFVAPYPARAAVEVSALPRGALVEAEAVVALS